MSKDADLRQLIEAGFAKLASDMASGLAKLASDMASGFAKADARLDSIDRRLVAVEARLDEQRQTINALIPTRIAAVGDKKAG
jgi:hypothetical protein